MLIERLRQEWRDHADDGRIDALVKVAAEGLRLGAGTILVGPDPGEPPDAHAPDDLRLRTLLTTAYGVSAASEALAHIKLAGQRWREGKPERADLHIALARLPRLDRPRQTAERLFLADGLMRAGIPPGEILSVLAENETVSKTYNPSQPRVPAGSGRPSGQWTVDPTGPSEQGSTPAEDCGAVIASPVWDARAVAALLNATKTRLATLLGGLSTEQLISLGLFAARFAGPTAALGYVFVPTDMGLREEGEVKGIPGLSYRWNRDETHMQLTYAPPGGLATTLTVTLGEGERFRDSRGNVVATALPNGSLIIDPAAAGVIAAARTKGSLCPDETEDYYGDGPNGGGAAFALFAKEYVNPGRPTPPGMGYATPVLVNGKPVVFDDCKLDAGRLFEFKGNYRFYTATGGTIKRKDGSSISTDWLSQSARQLQASEGKPITWLFSNPTDAEFARRLFAEAGEGRETIDIEVLPWERMRKWWAGITV